MKSLTASKIIRKDWASLTDNEIKEILTALGRKNHEVPDSVKEVATRFWLKRPESKPIGEARIRKDLRDLEVLLASGVSEAQIVRASELLSVDEYRRSWVSCLGKMAEKWPQIANQLNGHLKPTTTGEKWEHAYIEGVSS